MSTSPSRFCVSVCLTAQRIPADRSQTHSRAASHLPAPRSGALYASRPSLTRLVETSDSVDLHSSLSRQASTEVVSTEKETPVQSLTITNQVEVGVFSEGINCCKWSRNGKQFAAGGGEGMLTVYNFDGDSHESSLYASFSCGNEILSLDWGYPTTESNRDLIVYGTQEGGLGVMNATANTALFETTLPGVLAVVSVAFSPLMTSYCAATLGGSTPLSFWDLATNKMVVDGAALGAGVRVNCLEYLSSGAGLYCGCADGHIRLFDVRSNRVVSNEQVSTGQISGMRVLVTPEEGAVMFCCSTDGVVREFDCRSMSKISLKCKCGKPFTELHLRVSAAEIGNDHRGAAR